MKTRRLFALSLIPAIFLFILFALYISRAQKTGLIVTPGKYLSPSHKNQLVVRIQNKNVYFEILNAQGQTIMDEVMLGSDYERWLFDWGENDWLWVYGEEIASVAIPNAKGSFDIKELKAPEVRPNMPKRFRDGLPQSLRKEWGM